MVAIGTHRDLLAWQESMKLVVMIYTDTKVFPRKEMFGLASQMRRAAVSIPSNIAEGAGRNTGREFAQFLGVACGSLAELDTQLELASRFGYLAGESESHSQLRRVRQLLVALRKSMRARDVILEPA